jgi:DNA repair protein RAD50
MTENETKFDAAQGLTNTLHHLAADMEDKKNRLKKLQDDFTASDYTSKLEDKAKRSRALQDQKDTLNGEFRSLNLQANSRARLDLKRSEISTKSQEVKNMCVVCSRTRPLTLDHFVP